MEQALLSGLTLQVALIALLAGTLIVLVRKVRRLSAILPPAGALMLAGGARVGAVMPALPTAMLDGANINLGGESSASNNRLLFFFSMTCPISQAMIPIVRGYGQDLDVFFATDDESDSARQVSFAEQFGLSKNQFCVSETLGRAYGIERVPQAILIATDGRILSRGLVNNREHLDSLLNAAALETPTIQTYLAEQSAHS